MSVIADAVSYLPQCFINRILPPMHIPDVSNDAFKVQLARLGHIYYEHGDLKRFEKFANDFGFIEEARRGNSIYYRGYGKDPYVYVASQSQTGRSRCLGAAFVAQNAQEFEKAARVPGAIIKDLDDAPGGGRLITFERPNGTFMHVVYGQQEREVDTLRAPPAATTQAIGPWNGPFQKPRLGGFQRPKPAPSLVHKLGHLGYVCKEFEEELEFYTSNFNFVHSDIIQHDKLPNLDFMTFMHLDLGREYSDHHSFFLSRAPPGTLETYIHHSSFEVSDFETEMLGHQWLVNQKWKPVWGVGRHVLGSQIFDYWFDSSGFKVEHYTDGDLVNSNYQNHRIVAGPMAIWGDEMPSNFSHNNAS